MSKELNDLARAVADEQSAIDGVSENTRTRVIRMGKRLRTMQRMQKKEQTETGQTWKDWCVETKKSLGDFPAPTQTVTQGHFFMADGLILSRESWGWETSP